MVTRAMAKSGKLKKGHTQKKNVLLSCYTHAAYALQSKKATSSVYVVVLLDFLLLLLRISRSAGGFPSGCYRSTRCMCIGERVKRASDAEYAITAEFLCRNNKTASKSTNIQLICGSYMRQPLTNGTKLLICPKQIFAYISPASPLTTLYLHAIHTTTPYVHNSIHFSVHDNIRRICAYILLNLRQRQCSRCLLPYGLLAAGITFGLLFVRCLRTFFFLLTSLLRLFCLFFLVLPLCTLCVPCGTRLLRLFLSGIFPFGLFIRHSVSLISVFLK